MITGGHIFVFNLLRFVVSILNIFMYYTYTVRLNLISAALMIFEFICASIILHFKFVFAN